MNWQKKEVIDGILDELKENNKTIKDIKYIIRLGQVKYWVTWAEFISPKIKIKSYDTLDWIIVGDNWWIDRQYEGQDEDRACWNFRTMPEIPKFSYEKYQEWRKKYQLDKIK